MDSDLVDRKIKEFDAWIASRATEPRSQGKALTELAERSSASPRSDEKEDEVSSADDEGVPEIPCERWDDLS